jgi:hypothetical protein
MSENSDLASSLDELARESFDSETGSGIDGLDPCVKAHTAETARLESADQECDDGIS